MQIKNINPVERYVDKAILLVGIVFAGYLVYQNLVKDPNQVPLPDNSGVTVTPGHVGQKITAAVRQLRAKIRHPSIVLAQRPHVPNLIAGIVHGQVHLLPPQVENLPPIAIGPLNQPVSNITRVIVQGKTFYAPAVPVLTHMKIKQGRGVAILPSNANQPGVVNPAVGGNSPALPTTKDVAWVKLTADFAAAKWLAGLRGPALVKPGFAALPPAFQRTTFYRVQVERQILHSDGRWSSWHKISGFYINPLPAAPMAGQDAAGRLQILTNLDSSVANILEPAFYPLEQIRLRLPAPTPANRPQPIPQPGNFQRGNFRGGFPIPGGFRGGFGNGGGGGGGNNAPVMRQPVRQNQPVNQPGNANPAAVFGGGFPGGVPPVGFPGVGAMPGSTFPGVSGTAGTLSSLLSQKSFPIWFRDTSIVPGATYRYRMRVALYNPVYLFPYKTNNPAVVDHPWIYSPWTRITRPMTVRNRLYFFLDGGGGLVNGQAEFRIFKWVHGMWTYTTQYVSPGQNIGNVRPTSLISAATGRLEFKSVNFFTGYKLVAATLQPGGNSVDAVVQGPHGNLGIRRSRWDSASPLESQLLRRVNQTGRPVAAGAAAP